MESNLKEACTEIATLKIQIEDLARANLAATQERDTVRAEYQSMAARLHRVETKSDVVGLANSVSAHASGAAALRPAAISVPAQASGATASRSVSAPKSTSFYLFTGMREAKEWEVNEEEDMRQVLSQYQCNKGIVRIERLGRRKPQHKGGGRFVLAEYQDEHVPAMMANK